MITSADVDGHGANRDATRGSAAVSVRRIYTHLFIYIYIYIYAASGVRPLDLETIKARQKPSHQRPPWLSWLSIFFISVCRGFDQDRRLFAAPQRSRLLCQSERASQDGPQRRLPCPLPPDSECPLASRCHLPVSPLFKTV